MPTIKLTHVTVRLANDPGSVRAMSFLERGFSLFGGAEELAYVRETEPRIEAPDRANALDNLSLTIRDGETLSVIGPSGCGKTTLLRVIAGLVQPNSGEVLYDGIPLSEIPPAERGIGMVFQSFALYPHMQARENIGFFDLIRHHEDRIPERIRHIAEVMNIPIKHLLARKPPQLSGGERQRVAIARCLARDPRLFLFDEPLSSLDAKLRAALRAQLKRLIHHYGITTVYVTHDQMEAMALSDRIAVMNQGRIEQVGPYSVLIDDPVNRFIAGFLGMPSMNFFEGMLHRDTWTGQGITVAPLADPMHHGQAATLGIRPEHVQLAGEGFEAHVERVETLFDRRQQIIYTRLGRQPLTVVVPLSDVVQVGATVRVRFPVEHVRLFDAKTGQRVRA